MKCNQAQELMLLVQSGEGTSRENRRLSLHLEVCEKCRAYSEDLREITDTARETMTRSQPSLAVMAAIREEAEAACIHPRAKHWWQPLYGRAVGMAASLTLIVGAWMYYQQPDKQDPAPDMKTLMQMAAGETPEVPTVAQPVQEPQADDSFQRLASVLIEMEGLAMEEWTAADSSMLEDLKELDETESTDLL